MSGRYIVRDSLYFIVSRSRLPQVIRGRSNATPFLVFQKNKKKKTAPDGNLKSELVMLYYKAAAEEYGTDIA